MQCGQSFMPFNVRQRTQAHKVVAYTDLTMQASPTTLTTSAQALTGTTARGAIAQVLAPLRHGGRQIGVPGARP